MTSFGKSIQHIKKLKHFSVSQFQTFSFFIHFAHEKKSFFTAKVCYEFGLGLTALLHDMEM